MLSTFLVQIECAIKCNLLAHLLMAATVINANEALRATKLLGAHFSHCDLQVALFALHCELRAVCFRRSGQIKRQTNGVPLLHYALVADELAR